MAVSFEVLAGRVDELHNRMRALQKKLQGAVTRYEDWESALNKQVGEVTQSMLHMSAGK